MSTIELPDDLAAALAAAAQQQGATVVEFIAEMVTEPGAFDVRAERSTEASKRRSLSFVAAGRSGSTRGGAEAEELLREGGFGVDTAGR